MKHLFFDLDHTLWDFETNSENCLRQIWGENQATLNSSIGFATFLEKFRPINAELWRQLDHNLITHYYLRKVRFKNTFTACGIEVSDEFSLQYNERFLELLPHESTLLPGVLPVLDDLHGKFQLHIISNGYQHVQTQKMKSAGIFHHFDCIVTNDIAAFRKPHPGIFEFALEKANCKAPDTLMVGDNYDVDILGAENVGIKAIHYAQDSEHPHSFTHWSDFQVVLENLNF
jgi:putative hydrolase of the HAD superfamily